LSTLWASCSLSTLWTSSTLSALWTNYCSTGSS
jgi:hypothetical protein